MADSKENRKIKTLKWLFKILSNTLFDREQIPLTPFLKGELTAAAHIKVTISILVILAYKI